jgi:hypothetical protein
MCATVTVHSDPALVTRPFVVSYTGMGLGHLLPVAPVHVGHGLVADMWFDVWCMVAFLMGLLPGIVAVRIVTTYFL